MRARCLKAAPAGGHYISSNPTLTSVAKISSSSGDSTIASELEVFFISDENGNNGGSDFVLAN